MSCRPPSRPRLRCALAALCLCLACMPPPPVPRFAASQPWPVEDDGLLYPLEGVDFQGAWARPSARFSRYDAVWVRYGDLTYRGWPTQPTWRGGSGPGPYLLTPDVFDRLEEMIPEVFDRELERLKLRRARGSGERVLEVYILVGDLVIEKPLSSTFGADTALAASLGALSLQIDLLDSMSGQRLARVAERRRIQPEVRRPISVSAGDALYETRRIYGSWARRLRGLLEMLSALDTPARARP